MVTVKVEKLDRLKAKVAAITPAVRAEVRKAMEKGAEEIVAMARRLVPVDSGTLRNSIGWTWGSAPKGSIKLASAETGGDVLTIFAGNEVAYYAGMVEFGTLRQAAQAFFFPSYRANRRRVKAAASRALNKAIKKVAAGR